MARDHGRVLCKIWNDKDFRALSRSAQAMYMQLLSQQSVNNAGVLPLQVSKWAKGCDELTTEQVWADLEELISRGYVVVDTDTEETLIRSFIRNDGGMAHKYIFKNALTCAQAAESDDVRLALATELYRLKRSDATQVADILAPSEPDPDPDSMPSESHSNPIPMPPEPDPEIGMAFESHSNHCGVGEGEGVTLSSVVGYVGESRARAGARDETPSNQPPSRYCPKHPEGTSNPCWGCASAREAHESWTAGESARQSAAARRLAEERAVEIRQAAEYRKRAIADCGMCDADGFLDADGRKSLCSHDPDDAERGQRGMAAVRAAMRWNAS